MKSKTALREEMKLLLADIKSAELRSEQMLATVLALLKPGDVLSSFVPLDGEVNLSSLPDRCDELGITLVVPEFEGHQAVGSIQFREWSSDALLERVPGGWMHPQDGSTFPVSAVGTILVPGLAFTDQGVRLGRGGGFYDRLLAQCSARSIGVCFKEQLVDELPFEEHDQIVDEVFSC